MSQKPRILPYSYENSRDFDHRKRDDYDLERKSNVFVISEIIREADPEMKGAFTFEAGEEYCREIKK